MFPTLLDRFAARLPQPEAGLIRDLQRLLNTRTPLGYSEDTPAAETLPGYGLPGELLEHFAQAGRLEELCELIRWKVEVFEPRLKDVQVSLVLQEPMRLWLRIEATPVSHPEKNPLTVNALIHSDGRFDLEKEAAS